ncbi:hypothetical protein BDF20DRAFT_831558 [Mycotypha africana]|uniref:uncharacterized protein n=1 Tax=Mycotypha africana TaxID=64632 RepID=UPI002300DE72|nr:uncharacterized protein BDF20DRAFT_831558 [Mycotypha africana]KAI8991523.1 hypothetical protein BDF20DRAFT_831558 [Mycotypha africana]
MRTPRPVHKAVYSHVYPEKAPDPVLLAISTPACEKLELNPVDIKADRQKEEEFVSIFSGNKILPDTRPWSLNYAGHQFGFFAGQLGDGRAVSLFETMNSKGESWEVQLKGAGRTPYSRFGDGYAVLRSSIREFLMSEHMNALGVPTTRALALIATSREVIREDGPRGLEPERGAVVTRMAPSWLRFGNFELFYSRDDMDNVRRLADYASENVVKDEAKGSGNKYTRLFRNVTKRTAEMVAEWQAIGFNHGVMNTDNMSVLGLTMDYGPFQIMDYYDTNYVCNHSDDIGRYAFQRQPSVCLFNLVKLAVPLFELIGAEGEVDQLVFPDKDNETKEGVTDEETLTKYRQNGKEIVQQLLNEEFKDYFMEHYVEKMRQKLGLKDSVASETDFKDVIVPLLAWMTDYHVDYHRFYRSLSNYRITAEGEEVDGDRAIGEWIDIVTELGENTEACANALKPWLSIYRHRLLKERSDDKERKQRMDAVNPRFVLRNFIVDRVIESFDNDDEHGKECLEACLEACIHPYRDHYEDQRVEEWINAAVPAEDYRCSCSS